MTAPALGTWAARTQRGSSRLPRTWPCGARSTPTSQIVDAVVSSLQVPLPGGAAGNDATIPDALSLAQAVAGAERYTGATAVHAEALQDDPAHYKLELVNAGGLLVAVVDCNGSGMAEMLY